MSKLLNLAFNLEHLLQCKGYSPTFINGRTKVAVDSILNPEQKKALPKVQGNAKKILHYNGMSVLYHAKRKVPFFVAYNIDGSQKANQSPRPPFRADPRIEKDVQLNKAFYDKRIDITEFEIGHMASNNEMGRGKDGKVKAYQTFHFVNSAPQAEQLNTGIWKGLESYVIKAAGKVDGNRKICVFTGPVLRRDDPPYVEDPSFSIPLLFFKVVVFETPKGVFATAFMMSHEKKMIEQKMFVRPKLRRLRGAKVPVGFFDDFPYRKVFQVNLSFLEKTSGLKFSWRGVNSVEVPEQKKLIQKIKTIRNASDAKAAIRKLRGAKRTGTRILVGEDVTDQELKTMKFELNIALP